MIKKADVVLIIFLLAFAAVFNFIPYFKITPVKAEIKADGIIIETLSLQEDACFEINGGEILVEVKEHAIAISASSCPDKLCVRQGFISSGYIVCLPNKIVVEIVNEKTLDVDVIAH